MEQLGFESLTVGAVCVYPNRVKDACYMMKKLDCNIGIASVAAGFPEVTNLSYYIIILICIPLIQQLINFCQFNQYIMLFRFFLEDQFNFIFNLSLICILGGTAEEPFTNSV